MFLTALVFLFVPCNIHFTQRACTLIALYKLVIVPFTFMAGARDACTMQFLSGDASVCYGVRLLSQRRIERFEENILSRC